ncbi:MAG: class I SAM-dependent methyltransferase [Candidatus Acidiferrales bacterium]
MKTIPEWPEAQRLEKNLWDGVVLDEHYTLTVLTANAAKAIKLRNCVAHMPETALEVGIGPFGLGLIAFLPEISRRFGIDPLPLVSLDLPADSPKKSSAELRQYMGRLRAPVGYIRAFGEDMPVASDSMDLVLCCNALDHASDPLAVLREIRRVLKPGGLFFFEVDTLSVLGLAKWHTYTKYKHKDEILVKAHPYRMYESDVARQLTSCGFQIRKVYGHTFASNLIGHARDSTFLGTK